MPHHRRIRRFLANGGVIAYATESCFGLGCDPRNPRAVARILRLKRRPRSKGLILLGSAFDQLQPYLAPMPDSEIERFHTDYWPGPYTLLLPVSRHCPRWLRGHHDKLAVRVTAHREASLLCQALGMALVSTSANRAGCQPATTAAQCRRIFGTQVRLMPGRVGRRKRPSTIIDPHSGAVLRA